MPRISHVPAVVWSFLRDEDHNPSCVFATTQSMDATLAEIRPDQPVLVKGRNSWLTPPDNAMQVAWMVLTQYKSASYSVPPLFIVYMLPHK